MKFFKEGIQFIEYTSTPHRRVTTKNLRSKTFSQSFKIAKRTDALRDRKH